MVPQRGTVSHSLRRLDPPDQGLALKTLWLALRPSCWSLKTSNWPIDPRAGLPDPQSISDPPIFFLDHLASRWPLDDL